MDVSYCTRPGVVGPYHSSRITFLRLCCSVRYVLSFATLPGIFGTATATEYGITSLASAGDVGHLTSVWFVDTARQESQSLSTQVDVDQNKQDKRNTVKIITKSGWSQVQIQLVRNAAVVRFPIIHIIDNSSSINFH